MVKSSDIVIFMSAIVTGAKLSGVIPMTALLYVTIVMAITMFGILVELEGLRRDNE